MRGFFIVVHYRSDLPAILIHSPYVGSDPYSSVVLFASNQRWHYHALIRTLGPLFIMHCPFCTLPDTKVIDSRLVAAGEQVRRRRECNSCGERFTTFESAELVMPRIIKHNGIREPFNEDKLLAGIQRALEKRPVAIEDVEASITRIKQKLRSRGEREIPSNSIGELVMAELRQLDQVAYVRFASVYRSFQDLDEFRNEIDNLEDLPFAADPRTPDSQDTQK